MQQRCRGDDVCQPGIVFPFLPYRLSGTASSGFQPSFFMGANGKPLFFFFAGFVVAMEGLLPSGKGGFIFLYEVSYSLISNEVVKNKIEIFGKRKKSGRPRNFSVQIVRSRARDQGDGDLPPAGPAFGEKRHPIHLRRLPRRPSFPQDSS
jgi:hypothetical protein